MKPSRIEETFLVKENIADLVTRTAEIIFINGRCEKVVFKIPDAERFVLDISSLAFMKKVYDEYFEIQKDKISKDTK